MGQPGPGAKYGDEHLDRLRLIRRLQRDHLPLAEIRRRLDDLDDDEIRDLAGTEPEPAPIGSALDYIRTVLGGPSPAARPLVSPMMLARQMSPPAASGPAAPAPSPTMTITERSQWERILLAPDVELHVRRPSSRIQNKRIDRLVTIARELLEEA
jgi:DNA-binding transcriptional MerR regulator